MRRGTKMALLAALALTVAAPTAAQAGVQEKYTCEFWNQVSLVPASSSLQAGAIGGTFSSDSIQGSCAGVPVSVATASSMSSSGSFTGLGAVTAGPPEGCPTLAQATLRGTSGDIGLPGGPVDVDLTWTWAAGAVYVTGSGRRYRDGAPVSVTGSGKVHGVCQTYQFNGGLVVQVG